jgi:NAD(P)H-hydrate epimerase
LRRNLERPAVQRLTRVPKLPPRPKDAHKGSFGTVLVVAGSDGMLGAAILCARGALRGGAGLVRCALPTALRAAFTVAVPAATTVLRDGRELGAAAAAASAIAVGPGLGTGSGARELVRGLLTARAAMVIDADALNVLAPLRLALPRSGPRVITPHPGEAARLLATTTAAVQRDRAAAAIKLAARSGAVAVLKGAGTIVTDGAQLYVNRSGNPGMATGGSGDVLTGLLAALLAQGMAPFAAACLAVHAHGRAGDLGAQRLSQTGLCAEDLPLLLAEVLRP